MIKKILKKVWSPFGMGSFWVIGSCGSVLWTFIFWLGSRVSPSIAFNGDTVAGAFLGAFGFSYVYNFYRKINN